MRSVRGVLLLGALLVGSAHQAQAAGTSINFPAGSIIVPTTATYQDDCGAVSAYGLIYNVLRANDYLFNTLHKPRITINYAISDTKKSPNRCIPTNKSSPPDSDPSWNDGCDFSINGATPVKLVNNTATAVGNDTLFSTTASTGNADAFPQYAAQAIGATVTTISYYGGPFVISATDAPQFLGLLDGSLTAKDSNGNNIDFSAFRQPAGCSVFGNQHHVNVHRAQYAFTAIVAKQFDEKPPRLGLLQQDTNNETGDVRNSPGTPKNILTVTESGTTATFKTQNAHGLSNGDGILIFGVSVAGYNGHWTISSIVDSKTFKATMLQSGLPAASGGTAELGGGILATYLVNAGLGFSGAQGCPTGGRNVSSVDICPNGGAAGQIFDTFDFDDLVTNKLVIQDSGVDRYQMLWTPHWVSSANSTTLPNANEKTAFKNIANFLNKSTGLLGECAAIASYEGSYQGNATSKDLETDPTTGIQLQTCKSASGACAASTTNFGVIRNPSGEATGQLKNCSDKTTGTGSKCAYFPFPSDPFAQTGDFTWNAVGGHVDGYMVNTGTSSILKPGVNVLIAGISSNDKTKLTNLATAMPIIKNFVLTRNIKDNTPGKANVAYVAGHDQSTEMAGTKVILETLLQLGITTVPIVTTTVETTRGSPVFANVATIDSVVVGTFNNVQPASPLVCATPTVCVSSAADIPAWAFPFITGKMHATRADQLTSTASVIGSGTDFFNGGAFPPVTASSCQTSSFDNGERAVFTELQPAVTGLAFTAINTPLPLTSFCNANADTIGGKVIASLTHTDYLALMQKMLAGNPDGSGGFNAAYGGIDHSTPAVIQPLGVNSTRPTVAYVGALDGMLHAICASSDGPCNNAVGKELWAFLPPSQLPAVAQNLTRVDGSPHVIDAFGNFGTATRQFHTILTFQTGSGNASVAGVGKGIPAVYAINIDDPANPKVLWEYTVPVQGTPTPGFELGLGLTSNTGPVNILGVTRYVTLIQTNNGNTLGTSAGNGTTVVAIDLETGAKVWQFSTPYPALRVGTDLALPATGIPGGAVGVDKTGSGFFTDIVFGDLYGRLWDVDALTGLSKYVDGAGAPVPLFQFTTDYHAIGALPAVYSNGSALFAAFVSGGFDDPSDANWAPTGTIQSLVSVPLSPAVGSTFPLTETTVAAAGGFTQPLGADEKGFSQLRIVGSQLFITTDAGDVNNLATYDSTKGHAYKVDLTTAGPAVAIAGFGAGGAGSLAVQNAGGGTPANIYAAGASKQQAIGQSNGSTGKSVNTNTSPKVVRSLWLRTE